jgi:hypothetical protein
MIEKKDNIEDFDSTILESLAVLNKRAAIEALEKDKEFLYESTFFH